MGVCRPPNGRQGSCRPLDGRRNLNVKNLHLGPGAQGALNSKLLKYRYKILEKSKKYKLNCSGFYETRYTTFVT